MSLLINSIVYSVILKVWVFGGHTTNMYIVSSTMLDGSMERKKENKEQRNKQNNNIIRRNSNNDNNIFTL